MCSILFACAWLAAAVAVPTTRHSSRHTVGPRCYAAAPSQEDASSTQQPAPWSKQDLEQLTQQLEQQDEEDLGEDWRSNFEDEPESLFTYVEDAEDAWAYVLEEMKKLPQTEWEVCAACSM